MISTDNSTPEDALPPATPDAAPAPSTPEMVSATPEANEATPAADAADAAPATPAAPTAPDLSPAATGARLAELFPALFVGPDGKGVWRAIKLRIHADIQARAPGQFSKRTLGIFFSRYTTTTPYLKALAAPGAQRHDLDGQPAGEIADEHRNAAAEEVARRQAIAAERRASFRKPMPRAPAAPGADGAEPQPPRERAPREARRDERPRDRPRHDEPRRDDARRGPPGTKPPSRPASRPSPHRDAPQRHEARPAPRAEAAAPAAALPADPAQRERALLLRSFEASTISKANFCALKRITEAELDAALLQARAERR
jgi:ProP effector